MPNLESPNAERSSADHVLAFLRRARLDWLMDHFPPRLVRSAYVFVNGFITIGVLALLAVLSRNPFVFPSLGPTAYLLFFSPLAKTCSPRNSIFGHAVGLICGYAAFAVTGAGAVPFGAHPGVFWPRILAAALSLSATGALMVLLGVSHPPAGANDSNRFARHHLKTARARHHRSRGVPARRPGADHQSPCWIALSAMERAPRRRALTWLPCGLFPPAVAAAFE